MVVGDPAGGRSLEVCASIAATDAAREQGLAGLSGLSEGDGLLIVFPVEGEACITNAPVGFAIDAVFTSDSGEVVAVERGVPAEDEAARCADPVRRVLEVAEGVASEVEVGHQLRIDADL